jgi:magnesium chelatase subunit ChlD-like protein
VALDATLRQAAIRHARERTLPVKGMALQREDLCKKQYLRPCEHLIVFVVDASDSMGSGAEVRMKAAKGAVLAILRKAYQSRSEVAMVAFGGEQARVALPATSSIETAKRLLERLPTGGATPFADGLSKAWQVIRSSRLKNSGVRPVLVIISDGEANVPLCEGVSPLEELGALAEKIGQDRIEAIWIRGLERRE